MCSPQLLMNGMQLNGNGAGVSTQGSVVLLFLLHPSQQLVASMRIYFHNDVF
jgi:hypothetical protein